MSSVTHDRASPEASTALPRLSARLEGAFYPDARCQNRPHFSSLQKNAEQLARVTSRFRVVFKRDHLPQLGHGLPGRRRGRHVGAPGRPALERALPCRTSGRHRNALRARARRLVHMLARRVALHRHQAMRAAAAAMAGVPSTKCGVRSLCAIIGGRRRRPLTSQNESRSRCVAMLSHDCRTLDHRVTPLQ
jgi:hypothetical protein